MATSWLQVDVFAEGPYRGNPLAVIQDAASLTGRQMQAIASEMNLSETTFVMDVGRDAYEVRIFTPNSEIGFAGHPTLGTFWALNHLGLLDDDAVQRSRVGETRVWLDGEVAWFERTGTSGEDLERTEAKSSANIAEALGLPLADIGLEARELGRNGLLRPAFSNAGLEDQLMVPLKNLDSLRACRPVPDLLGQLAPVGLYCFTGHRAGVLRARGFFPGVGVAEDPATGSAAGALGLYLASRVGAIDFTIEQGVEMGRPSRLDVSAASPDRVKVGGKCHLVLSGRIDVLP
ncbi:MAG TPA: PhzF family phenazine biosynthesis protein [Actinomycetota bacterium]|nr:PhzF family phenazine biosynthesis protein [Actinomycetota bacterium]